MSRCRRMKSLAGPLACALALFVAPLGAACGQDSGQFPPEQLEAMVAPYLDLSTPLLAWVFNASKYPTAVADAAGALEMPPTATVDPAQLPSSVRGLMDSTPDLLLAMAADPQGTATLGTAYASQPGDVWIAVGAARTRASMVAEAGPEPDGSAAAASDVPPPAAGAPPPQEAPASAAASPAYYPAPTYAPVPPNTVVVQAPTPAGYSGGQVAAAGAVGFGVGAVTGALVADDDDFDVDIDQAYDQRSDLQGDRQDYGDERYDRRTDDREDAYDTRQADRSANYEQIQGDRDEARSSRQTTSQENQTTRQATSQENQAARQSSAQQQQATRQTTAQQGRAGTSSIQAGGGWGPFASAGGSRSFGRRR